MKEFKIDHITVLFQNFEKENEIIEDMAQAAIDYAEEHKNIPVAVINKIIVTKDGNKTTFDVEYNDEDQPKIGRIRRITGYLTGTTSRWNNSKRAELKDRVTHIG